MHPRVTRSKKVEIIEDDTAQPQSAFTSPPPYTAGPQLQTLAGNVMAADEDLVQLELKGLKAAYREVIGVSKKGKGRNKKNQKENALQNSEDLESPPIQPPVARTTRGRAKAQEGPYQDASEHNLFYYFKDLEQKSTTNVEQPRDAGFLTSLFAGRSTGPSRSFNASLSGPRSGRTANEYLSLAAQALKASSQESQKTTNIQVAVEADGRKIDLDIEGTDHALDAGSERSQEVEGIPITEAAFKAEPKELRENFRDQKAIPISSKKDQDSVDFGKSEHSHPDASNQISDQDGEQDSFVEQITSRSPAKSFTAPREPLKVKVGQGLQSPSKTAAAPCPSSPNLSPTFREQDNQTQDKNEDSFVEHITSRSPAKPRIEDSVEALDQMEEVEEALHEATLTERIVSPEKKRQKKEQPVKPGFQSMRVKSASKRVSVIKKAASMAFKPSDFNAPHDRNFSKELESSTRDVQKIDKSPISQVVLKDPIQTSKSAPRPLSHVASKDPAKSIKLAPRPSSQLVPKDLVKSTKPVTRPANFELPGEAIARKLKEQRERRKAQRESGNDSLQSARAVSGPSVKSTKPLTIAAFELPGEALSRKKREAHEARLKAQEEEELKRREFKAKPNLSNPRGTVGTAIGHARGKGDAPIVHSAPKDSAHASLTVSKRNSTVGAHRPSMIELTNMAAKTTVPRSPGSGKPIALERRPSTKFHGPSMSGLAMQRTVSATEVQFQRQRAKEIYNRDQRLAEDIEREKREREAAAKRSREEAAERGRQASREWAEKQRAKRLVEGDKGMSAGYGPGGQMGLKA